MATVRRLFIGLDLPATDRAALAALDAKLGGLRWLVAEQLHLTLSFLGEVADSARERLDASLREVRVPPFFLPLQGMGSFSARGRPSVVWVGVGRGHPHLFALHKHLQDAVLRAALEPDLKPLHPHVTVARSQGISREALQPLLRKHREMEFGLFRVEGFSLFSSELRPDGPVYRTELRVDF